MRDLLPPSVRSRGAAAETEQQQERRSTTRSILFDSDQTDLLQPVQLHVSGTHVHIITQYLCVRCKCVCLQETSETDLPTQFNSFEVSLQPWKMRQLP